MASSDSSEVRDDGVRSMTMQRGLSPVRTSILQLRRMKRLGASFVGVLRVGLAALVALDPRSRREVHSQTWAKSLSYTVWQIFPARGISPLCGNLFAQKNGGITSVI